MTSRTALLIRYSQEDAATVHDRAASERRTISGYLLYVLERSLWIEEKWASGLTADYLERQKANNGPAAPANKSTLLRCTPHEAERIRKAAQKRGMSISVFVRFSLHRHWDAARRANEGGMNVPGRAGGGPNVKKM